MKKVFRRFTRGGLILFAFQFSLFATILIFQGCDEINAEDNSIQEAIVDLKQVLIENQVSLNQFSNSYYDSQQKSRANLASSNGSSEEEAIEVLLPLLEKSKELLALYGVDDQQILEELGDVNYVRLIVLAVGAMSYEESQGSLSSTNGMNVFLGNRLYAQTDNPYVDCAIQALGLNLGFGTLHDLAEEGLEKTVKKFLKKVAWRVLGPIGVAITVAEYAWCLNNKLQ